MAKSAQVSSSPSSPLSSPKTGSFPKIVQSTPKLKQPKASPAGIYTRIKLPEIQNSSGEPSSSRRDKGNRSSSSMLSIEVSFGYYARLVQPKLMPYTLSPPFKTESFLAGPVGRQSRGPTLARSINNRRSGSRSEERKDASAKSRKQRGSTPEDLAREQRRKNKLGGIQE